MQGFGTKEIKETVFCLLIYLYWNAEAGTKTTDAVFMHGWKQCRI